MQPSHLFVTTYRKFRNRFLQLGDSCAKCDSGVLQEELLPLTGHIIDTYNKLQLKCHSCQSKIPDMMSHTDICKGPPVHSKSKVLLFGVKMETKIKKSLPQLHTHVEENVAKVATTVWRWNRHSVCLTCRSSSCEERCQKEELVEVYRQKEEYIGSLLPDVCLDLRSG